MSSQSSSSQPPLQARGGVFTYDADGFKAYGFPLRPIAGHWIQHQKKKWIMAQLTLYGISFDKYETRTSLIKTLCEARKEGKCDSPPRVIVALQQKLAAEYYKTVKETPNVPPDDASLMIAEARCHPGTFLAKHFLDEHGDPDRSKTKDGLVLQSRIPGLGEAVASIPGLGIRATDECTVVAWESNLDSTIGRAFETLDSRPGHHGPWLARAEAQLDFDRFLAKYFLEDGKPAPWKKDRVNLGPLFTMTPEMLGAISRITGLNVYRSTADGDATIIGWENIKKEAKTMAKIPRETLSTAQEAANPNHGDEGHRTNESSGEGEENQENQDETNTAGHGKDGTDSERHSDSSRNNGEAADDAVVLKEEDGNSNSNVQDGRKESISSKCVNNEEEEGHQLIFEPHRRYITKSVQTRQGVWPYGLSKIAGSYLIRCEKAKQGGDSMVLDIHEHQYAHGWVGAFEISGFLKGTMLLAESRHSLRRLRGEATKDTSDTNDKIKIKKDDKLQQDKSLVRKRKAEQDLHRAGATVRRRRPDTLHPGRLYFVWAGRNPDSSLMEKPVNDDSHSGHIDFDAWGFTGRGRMKYPEALGGGNETLELSIFKTSDQPGVKPEPWVAFTWEQMALELLKTRGKGGME